MPGFVKTTWLPKSTGVIPRDQPTRIRARDKRVHQYFYGPKKELEPYILEIKYSEIKDKIFKIGPSQGEGVSWFKMELVNKSYYSTSYSYLEHILYFFLCLKKF